MYFMQIRKVMTVKRNSSKIVLSLVVCTVLIFGIYQLQNDYTAAKNMIELNKSYFELASLESSKNTSADKLNLSLSNTTINLPVEVSIISNAIRPDFSNLEIENIYWQILVTTNRTIKLFSAFYDDRDQSQIGPSIRMIALINRFEVQNMTTYCQFWINGLKNPIISETIEYQLIWHKEWGWDNDYLTFLITCPFNINKYQKIPEGVSLVNNYYDQAQNYLKVVNNRPAMNKGKIPFAVCVKDFTSGDQNIVFRLIEWIELLRILGADKIFMYPFNVTGKIRRVFDYYEHYGILKIVKLSYPKDVTFGRLYNELISLNDCFYRNMYLYDYIAIFDIDEIIIPKYPDDMTWMDMLKRIKLNQTIKESYSTYNFQNVYFLDDFQHIHNWQTDFPHYLHILQHINRSINYTEPGYSIKSFHDTELVKSVHNHYPISCFHECMHCAVNTEFGHLAHYRRVCPQPWLPEGLCKYYLNHTIEDKSAWKYKDNLIKQVMKVVNMLDLIENGKN